MKFRMSRWRLVSSRIAALSSWPLQYSTRVEQVKKRSAPHDHPSVHTARLGRYRALLNGLNRGGLSRLPGLTDRTLHEPLVEGVGHALHVDTIDLGDAPDPRAIAPMEDAATTLGAERLGALLRADDRCDS